MNSSHIYNIEQPEIKTILHNYNVKLVGRLGYASYLGKEEYESLNLFTNTYTFVIKYWFRETYRINKITYNVYFSIEVEDFIYYDKIENVYNRRGARLNQKEINNFKEAFYTDPLKSIPYNLPKKESVYLELLELKLGVLFLR